MHLAFLILSTNAHTTLHFFCHSTALFTTQNHASRTACAHAMNPVFIPSEKDKPARHCGLLCAGSLEMHAHWRRLGISIWRHGDDADSWGITRAWGFNSVANTTCLTWLAGLRTHHTNAPFVQSNCPWRSLELNITLPVSLRALLYGYTASAWSTTQG